ncbi:MAG: FAD-dependent oxidoreductase [Candidatus Gastranaerophilales bacterium]|nr:FAD-dependent oxidoreductase [Candidatus Gastranaerophilales bacterium]
MMENKKTVAIVGAGPCGLAVAYELLQKDKNIKPIIIEKLGCVGGLSRTVYKDNLGVDIGGHRLHTNDEYIKSIWFKFLEVQNSPAIDDILANRDVKYPKNGKNPNEEDDVMLVRKRFSSIIYNSKFFPYPLKFSLETFLNLGLKTSFKAGCSYIKSMIFKRKENNLEDFMVNRFGEVLYSIFFKDYTKKVWGLDASQLSCEWGHQRIRKLSLFKTILNSILSQFKFIKFKKETSLIDEFYYPKYGCSQLWDLMAKYIIENGGEIILNSEFVDFNYHNDKILSLRYKTQDNEIKEIPAHFFVSTMPIKDLIVGVDAPYDIKQEALSLPYRDYILASFYTKEFNLKNSTNYPTINNITPDCWIYLQEKDAIAARIQIMNNWSPYLVGDYKNNYLISLEYFANETDDFWQKSDSEIINIAQMEAQKYNLFNKEDILQSFVVREKKAYPTYFGSYKEIDKIKKHLSKYTNLYLAGRNGQHKYNNMDEAMICGINVAREISGNV